MYKLVAIDLDGTLLNFNKQISDIDKETINYALNSGVKILVCSGRIFAGARIFARYLGINGPLIACNGAIIKEVETDEVLYSDFLEFEACKEVIDFCKEEDLYFHIYAGDTMYTERLEFSSKFYWDKNLTLSKSKQVDIRLVEDITKAIRNKSSNIAKIVAVSKDLEKLSSVRSRVANIKSLSVVSSNSDNFEVVNGGVSKGNALKFVAEKLGICKSEIIAIGDNENDCSMLDFAGLAVAMGNAEDYIKEMADYITLSNNDNGVSEVLKKFVL
jgi:Cof subfamily protein (haloacid dehalogenase superfamily)